MKRDIYLACLMASLFLIGNRSILAHTRAQLPSKAPRDRNPKSTVSESVTNTPEEHISSTAQTYTIGDVVEDFTLPSANGDSISLYDYWGAVVLIHIWFSG